MTKTNKKILVIHIGVNENNHCMEPCCNGRDFYRSI